jgi:hypothetical protein
LRAQLGLDAFEILLRRRLGLQLQELLLQLADLLVQALDVLRGDTTDRGQGADERGTSAT